MRSKSVRFQFLVLFLLVVALFWVGPAAMAASASEPTAVDEVVQFLANNLEAIASIFITLCGIFGVQWRVKKIAEQRFGEKGVKLWKIVIGSVSAIYEESVKALKLGQDGTLSPEQATMARRAAYDRVIKSCRAEGIEPIKFGGEDFVFYLIETAVEYLKGKRSAPIEVLTA